MGSYFTDKIFMHSSVSAEFSLNFSKFDQLNYTMIYITNNSQFNTTTIDETIINTTSVVCHEGQIRMPKPNTVPYYVGIYVAPVIFLIGMVGNILNLMVLNSKGMRTKTNFFLSTMAATDLCFFLVMFALNLSAFDTLAGSETFNRLYFEAKMTLTALANWFSIASIWIAITVTVERLVAIRRPLHARLFWKTRRIAAILISIYVLSFCLSVYFWFWMWPISIPKCNSRPFGSIMVYGLKMVNRTESPITYDYVMVSHYVAAFCTVLGPVLALMCLNSLLLYSLRQNRLEMIAKFAQTEGNSVKSTPKITDCSKKSARRSNITTAASSIGSVTINTTATGGSQSQASIRQRTCESKVAVMVSVITVSFIIFLTPSAVLFVLEQILYVTVEKNRQDSPWFGITAYISNQLVVINKSMNFILYCSAGQHFRRRLFRLLCHQMPGFKRYYYNNSRHASRYLSSRNTENHTLNSMGGPENSQITTNIGHFLKRGGGGGSPSSTTVSISRDGSRYRNVISSVADKDNDTDYGNDKQKQEERNSPLLLVGQKNAEKNNYSKNSSSPILRVQNSSSLIINQPSRIFYSNREDAVETKELDCLLADEKKC